MCFGCKTSRCSFFHVITKTQGQRERGREYPLCMCVSAIFSQKKGKKQHRREGRCQASNDRVCSLFCATVFALEACYEKSLCDSRAPTLLCASIHYDLLQGESDSTPPDQELQTKTPPKKSKKLRIIQFREVDLTAFYNIQKCHFYSSHSSG